VPKAKKTNRGTVKSQPKGRKTRQLWSGSAAKNGGATTALASAAMKSRGSRLDKSLIPKEDLAEEIATIIRYHHLTQTEAARIVGDAPSQMSLLLAGKLEGFSTERLLHMLLRLGRDIELVFAPAQNPRGAKFRIRHKSTLRGAT
jgi:predicted XRE-type DNA-binding protein